jgi:toxin ParE1/3/4
VAEYRYSLQAEADADEITAFTIRKWDVAQAARYISGLEALCQALADGNGVGRACDHISIGLFRIDYVSHVVFYRARPYGVRIVRVLHQRQLPEVHSFEDDEDEPEYT